jgi:UDP-2,3-diacylglucosamine hydrolase
VRQAQARALRTQSEARKRSAGAGTDLDATACRAWLASHRANTLIHGHTHRPAAHDLGEGLTRLVLSDWDASAHPARAEVLRLRLLPAEGHRPTDYERLSPSQALA